jgi:hypothetical protein
MPAFVAGIHALLAALQQERDGGNKPGHDDATPWIEQPVTP